ncbi:hypothetical protein I5Q34_18480 [Streptomyces sp. AV19]|uniref:hypothetical protein n=1 Tax=Streptomyces sp. AV19 TaxID=2793068 RepID=UPI0018FE67F5|nr:hypothetical protein [Streptomyces sp. AV19]MBH1936236.1 hypothetical protein [Streptomyces sp. AV19]MDG4532271.1 hypothetical protein [Streptomyces sp. AV19]
MGWTVLYLAFGVVGLWLLGEVLFQYKARLRWRLLAFTGFLGVVAGVLVPSVVVIAVGAIAFAVGQVYVTVSFRRGFSAGWALRRRGRESRGETPVRSGRRRGKPARAAEKAPDEAPAAKAEPPAPRPPSVPDPDAATAMMPAVPRQPGHDEVLAAEETTVFGGTYDAYGTPAGAPVQGATAASPYGGQFDYGQQDQYAAYSDPYIGNLPPAGAPQGYGQQQSYGADAWATGAGQYDTDTPPGGVWVPQQRDTDFPPQQQGRQQPPYPPQQGYEEQQYRY